MNRFFRATPSIYEAIRSEMDASSGYPNNQATTWFVPASEAIKDEQGNCVIAANNFISENFSKNNVDEISEEQYFSIIQQ